MLSRRMLRRYFDRRWYASRYGRKWPARAFPRWYHRRRGWKKGYNPHPLFDADWYLAEHPDVAHARLDPLAHYVEYGWREGRSPHPAFDAAWYLAQNPDVAAAGKEPLRHYLHDGWKEGRQPHPAFASAWYLASYPDVAATRSEPLAHYLTYGWKEGRQPHPLFDGERYRQQAPECDANDVAPLSHYLAMGWREQREPICGVSLAAFVAALPETLPPGVNPFVHFLVTEYEPIAHDASAVARLLERYGAKGQSSREDSDPPAARRHPGDVQAIAMYLPQFHRVPENDRWWGEGFTEWTNVRRGRPLYPGHEQPHVPHDDIGYYDLDDPQVLERQAALAARYGIHGFCFYYYWFDGRRILERPIDRMLRSGKPDFPFCFCWANENWTRTWDGRDREILLEQRHSAAGDERFLRDLLPALHDPRYIRIDGKPLLVVYRPALLDDAAAAAARWRSIAKGSGLEGLHLAAVQSFDRDDPCGYGFDSAIQFPPLQIPAPDLAAQPGFAAHDGFCGHVHDYREAVRHAARVSRPRYPLFRGVMPRWDNTARRMERATSWAHATPERYGEWLRAAVEETQREHPNGRQMIFINAWNEWAEGAHLEPDTRHGYRYLEETLAALRTAQGGTHGLPLESTSGRHPDVIHERHARLEKFFGGELPIAVRDSLSGHVALVSQLASGGARLAVDHETARCEIAGETLVLDGPAALARGHERVWGDGRERPFAFVLLQFGKPEVTARCVDSILRLDPCGRQVHVVIVDNASSPEVVAATKRQWGGRPQVTLLCNRENEGFARGNNVGYRHAREVLGADYIAVVNNDTVLEDAAFIRQCLAIFGRQAYSVLGPDIVTPDGRHENPWNDCVYARSEWQALAAVFERQRETWRAGGRAEFRRIGSRSAEAREILDPVLQGAAYVFSPVFTREKQQPFDERTFLYGEEFLLAVDCLLSGHPTLYSSELAIRHEEGVSTASMPDTQKIAHGYDGVSQAIGLARTRLDRQAAAAEGICLQPAAAEITTLTGDGRRHVLMDLLFCQPGFHGGGEYGKAVFRAVVDLAAKRGDVQVWAAVNPAIFIDGWVWELCRRHSVNLVAVQSFDDIVALVDTGRFDTFFAPAIVVYTGYEYLKRVGGPLKFAEGRTRVIGTLLDIRDLELAEEWPRIARARKAAGCMREIALSTRQWEAESARQARHAEALRDMYQGICATPALDTLVTISEYSADSIRGRVGTVRPIHVLFPPEKQRARAEAFAWPGIDLAHDPFALVLNAGREEKNAASIIAACDRLFDGPAFAAANPRLKVVLTGIGRLDDVGIPTPVHAERFVTMPQLPPGRLEYLLARARFLAYASFNEGFGYPPLEAMSHGTPSLIADNTSVPEVCGAAAVRCDPFDLDSITTGICRILTAPPAANAIEMQVAETNARQLRDVEALADLICSRVAAEVDLCIDCEADGAATPSGVPLVGIASI
jgi:GT2 family glycosyltransferase/glycosyltransferase involved in cell wall biosynthesis